MYNMDISILGLKLNVEILILIGVIYLILVGHTIGGCCKFNGLLEGMQNQSVSKSKNNNNGNSDNMAQVGPSSTSNSAIANKVAGTINKKEGFVGANTNYGESSLYSLTNNQDSFPTDFGQQSLTVTPGKPLNSAVRQILNRPSQPVPLPEGEMLMFANTEFKPECCPNTYSTSTGCACMTTNQYNYLVLRGGNNVPYAEY